MPTLYIGNRNYSSWSLRPWLALKWAKVPFDEVVIPLGGPGYGKSQIPEILAVSPSGRVPALELHGTTNWDSLAIAEWATEQPNAGLLPSDPLARAVCRSAVAEMHSGFPAVRRDLSMNLRRRTRATGLPADTLTDIHRITELWSDLREKYGGSGPWLFGQRSLADAFYAPVVTRFRSYGIDLPEVCASYSQALFGDPDFRAWEAGAEAETWTIESADALFTEPTP